MTDAVEILQNLQEKTLKCVSLKYDLGRQNELNEETSKNTLLQLHYD